MPRSNATLESEQTEHRAKTGVLPAIRRLLAGIFSGGSTDHADASVATASKMPHVDTDKGNVLVGNNDYPKEQYTGNYFDKPKLSADAVHTTAGDGDRSMYFRNVADPAADTSIRTWGIQGSAEIAWGNDKDFDDGYFGDLTGYEGSFMHWGSGTVKSAIGAMTNGTNRGGGRIEKAIGYFVMLPCNAHPNPAGAGQIDEAYGIYVYYSTEGYADPVKKYGLVVEDGCGPCGIGYTDPVAKLAVNGGINAGGKTDPGAGNIKASGTFVAADDSTGVSGTFTTTDGKTITVKNGIVTSIV